MPHLRSLRALAAAALLLPIGAGAAAAQATGLQPLAIPTPELSLSCRALPIDTTQPPALRLRGYEFAVTGTPTPNQSAAGVRPPSRAIQARYDTAGRPVLLIELATEAGTPGAQTVHQLVAGAQEAGQLAGYRTRLDPRTAAIADTVQRRAQLQRSTVPLSAEELRRAEALLRWLRTRRCSGS